MAGERLLSGVVQAFCLWVWVCFPGSWEGCTDPAMNMLSTLSSLLLLKLPCQALWY